jgi:hypothetical protein
MKGKSILINDTHYDVDNNLCIEVEDEANLNKALNTGWTDQILQTKNQNKRGRPTIPRPSLNSAKEFVALVAAQPAIQEQCEGCQTFSELLKSVGHANGYNFNQDHLNQARAAHIARNADIKPGGGTPQHSQLAREVAAVEATVPQKEPEPKTKDEMSSPFGSYSKKVLKDLAKELGLTEADLLMAAYNLDKEREEPKGHHGVADFMAGVADAGLLPLGAVPPVPTGDGKPAPKSVAEVAAQAAKEAEEAAAAKEAEEAEAAKTELMATLAESGFATETFETSGNWPEPNADMPIEFLKKMADGYEVKYASNIGAATLVERIAQAMYPDGD